MKSLKVFLMVFSLVFVLPNVVKAQDVYRVGSDTATYYYVEEMPEPSCGGMAYGKFIIENLRRPKGMKIPKEGIRVHVCFVVNKDGSVSDFSVPNMEDMKGNKMPPPHPDLFEAAKKTILAAPKWTPGKHKGKLYKVYRTYPVTFTKRTKVEG